MKQRFVSFLEEAYLDYNNRTNMINYFTKEYEDLIKQTVSKHLH